MQNMQNKNQTNLFNGVDFDKIIDDYKYFSALPKGQTIKLISEWGGNTHFEYAPESFVGRTFGFITTGSLSASDATISAVIKKYSDMGDNASKLFKTILNNAEKLNANTIQNTEDFIIVNDPIEKARTAFWHFAASRQGLHTMADTLVSRNILLGISGKISNIYNTEKLQTELIKNVFTEALKKLSTLGEFVRDKKDPGRYNFIFFENKADGQEKIQKNLESLSLDLSKVNRAYNEFCSNFKAFSLDMEKYSSELKKFSADVVLNERMQIAECDELKNIANTVSESISSIEVHSPVEGREKFEFCIATLHLFFCGSTVTEQQKFVASLATAAIDQSNTRNSFVHLFKNFEPAFSGMSDVEVDKLLKKEIQTEDELDLFYKDHPRKEKNTAGQEISISWSDEERKELVQSTIYKPTTPPEIAAARLSSDYPLSNTQLWQKRAGQFMMRLKMPLEALTKEYKECKDGSPTTLKQLEELDRYFNMAVCLANLSKDGE